jgi:hypothetical protein
VRVTVGPVEPVSAHAWIGWAREMLGALRREPEPTLTLPTQVVEDVGSYVDSWAGAAHNGSESFRWNVDVEPDELEYLTNCL